MKKFCAKEKAELNQFWYSCKTVDVLISELVLLNPRRVAFLSTPTLFAAAQLAQVPGDLFDIDPDVCDKLMGENWKYVPYDFRSPEVANDRKGSYDVAILDPPFISSNVLQAYSLTVHQLLVEGGKVIVSSVQENGEILSALFPQIRLVRFKPSIPNLVYQYSLFTNYQLHTGSRLDQDNIELQA